eukprot:jgi/Orpsp1_1/1192029/evm.model.d7180000090060.1
MIFKNIFKTVGFLSLVVSAFAETQEESNDCKEIESILNDSKVYYNNVVRECEVNEDGELIN